LNEELNFDSGPRQLAGRLFSPQEGAEGGIGVLFIHGSDSHQGGYHSRAEAVTESLGATCLTFDLSGHGESEGSREQLSARDHLGDCLAAFDTLAGRPEVDPSRIGVCAASYGGFLAALLIAERPVGSLLLRAPALYPDSDLDRAGGPRHSGVEEPETAASLRNVAGYNGPMLVVESERDKIIPHAVIEAYLSVYRNGRHEVMPDVGHRLDTERSRALFIEVIVEWFRQTLGV